MGVRVPPPALFSSKNLFTLNIQSESLGNLHEKVTITISPEDYQEKFRHSIKDLSKKVQIKGFRPGHVPSGMVKKMYGDQALADEINKLVNKAVEDHLKENNNEMLGDPIPLEEKLQEIDHRNDKAYTFSFELGLQPEFEIGLAEGDVFTWYRIPASDNDIDQEMDRLRKKYGKREEVEQAQDLDVVYVHLQELDEQGAAKEEGIHVHSFFNHEMLTDEGNTYFKDVKKDFSGNIDNLFALFKGERSEVAKNVLQMKEVNDEILAAISPSFECKVERIVRLIAADLNEEFFTAVAGEYGDAKDEDELRQAIRSAIENYNDSITRGRLDNDLYKAVVEKTDIALPEEFLTKWYEKNRMNKESNQEGEETEGEEKQEDPEPLPVFMKRLKESLIFRKVQKSSDLHATQEEIIQEAINHTRSSYGQLGEEFVRYIVENNIKDRTFVESMHDRVLQGKFLDVIRGMVTIQDEAITLEEYQNLQKEESNVEQ